MGATEEAAAVPVAPGPADHPIAGEEQGEGDPHPDQEAGADRLGDVIVHDHEAGIGTAAGETRRTGDPDPPQANRKGVGDVAGRVIIDEVGPTETEKRTKVMKPTCVIQTPY